jgi:hypothetical protein
MKFLSFAAAGVLVFVAPRVFAHPGPRIWVNVQDQQVTTYQGAYPPGDPSNYTRARVFSQPLSGEDDVWYSDFPGFQQVPGGTIPTSTNFGYDIAGPLLYYEPPAGARTARFRTVARHFGGSSAVPQIAVTNELFQTRITASGFVQGDLAFAYNGGAGDHNHLTYTLLPDGTTAGGGADGIYVLSLRLTSESIAPSEPYFLLLGKNATADQMTDAMTLANRTLVLPGDANGDSVVSFADFQRLERGFGNGDAGWQDGDFNSDGLVNQADFLLLRENFGHRRDGTPTADGALPEMAQVPEPYGAALVACALLPLFSIRKRRLS